MEQRQRVAGAFGQMVRLAIIRIDTHNVIIPLKATMPAKYTLATLFRVWTARLGFMADLSENGG